MDYTNDPTGDCDTCRHLHATTRMETDHIGFSVATIVWKCDLEIPGVATKAYCRYEERSR